MPASAAPSLASKGRTGSLVLGAPDGSFAELPGGGVRSDGPDAAEHAVTDPLHEEIYACSEVGYAPVTGSVSALICDPLRKRMSTPAA